VRGRLAALRHLPLGRAAAAAAVLVLTLGILYYVRFGPAPAGEDPAVAGTSLKVATDWPDRLYRYWVQLASVELPAAAADQAELIRRWQQERARAEGLFRRFDPPVEVALWRSGTEDNEIILCAGFASDRDSPWLTEILKFARTETEWTAARKVKLPVQDDS